MEKNISSFVYKHYIFYNTKNLILRILGLFLISCSAIFYVEIGSPYGFDSVNFFSETVYLYTIAITAFASLISILSRVLYKIKQLWSCILMRCITNIYISVLFLTVSVFNYDGKAFYTDDKIVIAIKVLLYLAVIPVDLFILNKWIIPKCNHKSNSHSKSYGYCLCIIGVVLFREIMRNNYQSVNIQELLKTIAYLFAVVMLINGIYYFMQAFFAKKYSLDILSDYTETYVNSLRRL